MKTILQNDNVQLLIKTFDLVMPEKKHTLRVYDYELENGFIVINGIEVMNRDGTVLQEADLEKVVPYLDQYEVKFKLRE